MDRIHDRVDPDIRTVKVRLLVSNTGLQLKPEMFINASLAVTVPASALMAEGDRGYGFVAIEDFWLGYRSVSGNGIMSAQGLR